MDSIKILLDFTARPVEFTEMYSKCTKRIFGSCLSHEVIHTNSVVLVVVACFTAPVFRFKRSLCWMRLIKHTTYIYAHNAWHYYYPMSALCCFGHLLCLLGTIYNNIYVLLLAFYSHVKFRGWRGSWDVPKRFGSLAWHCEVVMMLARATQELPKVIHIKAPVTATMSLCTTKA
jgi:hypothetical protein